MSSRQPHDLRKECHCLSPAIRPPHHDKKSYKTGVPAMRSRTRPIRPFSPHSPSHEKSHHGRDFGREPLSPWLGRVHKDPELNPEHRSRKSRRGALRLELQRACGALKDGHSPRPGFYCHLYKRGKCVLNFTDENRLLRCAGILKTNIA